MKKKQQKKRSEIWTHTKFTKKKTKLNLIHENAHRPTSYLSKRVVYMRIPTTTFC